MSDDVHTLSGLYALDALEEPDRVRFEGHLRRCPACTQEVAELRATATRLGRATAALPPPNLKTAVMAEVGLTRQEAPRVGRLPRPSRLTRALALAAAAVVALVIGLLSFRLVDAQHELDQSEQVAEVLTSPDATTTRLTGEAGITAVVAGSPSLGRTVVALDGLAPVGDDQAYALWLIDAEGPEPMGLVRPDGHRRAVAMIDANLSQYGAFGLTVERRAGSPVPTGPLLVEGPLA
jgi:hypothetical protein